MGYVLTDFVNGVDAFGDEYEDCYGIYTLESLPSYVKKGINTLHINRAKVQNYKEYKDKLHGNVPSLYCVRTWCDNRETHIFECGLHILKNGKIWVGLNREEYETIEEAFEYLNSRIEGWSLWMEEEMLITTRPLIKQ